MTEGNAVLSILVGFDGFPGRLNVRAEARTLHGAVPTGLGCLVGRFPHAEARGYSTLRLRRGCSWSGEMLR